MLQVKLEGGRIEKWVLRKAFDDEEHPYLPKVRKRIKYSISRGKMSLILILLQLIMLPLADVCIYHLQHILYRQKEQFSDGVGYSWIDGLKEHAAQHVSHSSYLSLLI